MNKQISLLLFGITMISIGCTNNKKEVGAPGTREMNFGSFEGKPVVEYTLVNAKGMEVSVINYGGTITKLITPDKNGKPGDVVLGFDSLDGYLQPTDPYFGSLIGRFGNRIANAKFTYDSVEYKLSPNNSVNSLHGGSKGFDKVYWTIETLPGNSSLKLTYQSKDGEEGYPGNLNVQVIYTLTEDNSLKIEYTATTDKATPVNLTSHAYFNLSAGHDSTILNHKLEIKSDKYLPVNAQLIPTGSEAEVKNGAMDFNAAKPIGKDLGAVSGGYDHNWILNKKGNELEKIASLYDEGSGRYMEVFTTEPGLQFYSGNFLDGTLKNTKGGAKYVKHAALCLEAQHFPDSPNQPAFPNTFLKPGETYKQTTIYKFSTKND